VNYSEHIQNCIDQTLRGDSNLDEYALAIQGMSSPKVRNLLNFLVSMPSAKYLEIGVFKGSTFYSALVNNNPMCAVAIDNWSQFGGHKSEFQNNIDKLSPSINGVVIDQDSFSDNISQRLTNNKFNIYFYDGDHKENDQRLALSHYIHHLENEFIYICDDWNWNEVVSGTKKGIAECDLKIVNEWTLHANQNGDNENWWNGLWVAHIKK